MNPPLPSLLHRRQFIKSAAITGLALAAPGVAASADVAASSAAVPRDVRLATLDEALAELEALSAAGEPVSHTTWNWAQTLTHCAQSIEYSMTGFPESKPALFQYTVGTLAYQVFAWRGRMSHDIAEPIPAAPTLEGITDSAKAEARLREAISTFRVWQAEFQPHFAYGSLSREQYEQAHALHLANHFSWFLAADSVVTS